jgi:pilus assembly protein CpaB
LENETMRNKRILVVLGGAAVFGLIAAVSVSRYLSNAQAFTKNLNNVIVAKVEIPVGTKIIAEQLTTIQFPKNATPDGVFTSAEKVVGRVAVTRIAAREPLTEFKLTPDKDSGGLSPLIPEGYRAMTVKVDDVMGISGFIMPGTLVDVVVVIEPPQQGGMGANPISKIVLQNIKVLANGQNIDKPEDERKVEEVRAVTLQVTPEQAEILALASTEGKLRLVMRNSTDQADEVTPGANKRSLLEGMGAMPVPEAGSLKTEQPKPVTAPRKPRALAVNETRSTPSTPVQSAPVDKVEVIEGTKKRTVEFP